MPRGSSASNSEDQRLVRRLDAIIGLLLEFMQATKVPGFSVGKAARVLNSAGITPTEVAKVLGKKSAQGVAPYLYGKAKKKQRSKKH